MVKRIEQTGDIKRMHESGRVGQAKADVFAYYVRDAAACATSGSLNLGCIGTEPVSLVLSVLTKPFVQ
jgi:hypothetical protein